MSCGFAVTFLRRKGVHSSVAEEIDTSAEHIFSESGDATGHSIFKLSISYNAFMVGKYRTAFCVCVQVSLVLAVVGALHAQEVSELYVGPVMVKVGMPQATVVQNFRAKSFSFATMDKREVVVVSQDKKDSASLVFENGKLVAAERVWKSSADSQAAALAKTLVDVFGNQIDMGLKRATVRVIRRTYPSGGFDNEVLIMFDEGRTVSISCIGLTASNEAQLAQVAEGISK